MQSILRLIASAFCFGLTLVAVGDESQHRVMPQGELPHDSRLAPLKDLNGYFPFTPPASVDAWQKRAKHVRRQILVSQGLWPQPTKTPLNAIVHGLLEQPEYTVEKVYFESVPGFFVTGNLYRPKNVKGKVPGVLFAHGHWRDARLSLETDENLREEIATGQERFEQGGRSKFQSMCVELARMGCIVWQWDMLGESDSLQLSHDLVHGFARQRPEMNTTENWGLFSPQAEANLQSVMGLQTWNSVRSLDFLLSLPEVDPDRIAMTGASGGATQTIMLSAIDPRVKLAFPAVMVSTAMQGGCTCENASLLRVGTGNVEFAALFAPKPLGMTTANDWTRAFSEKGYPDLQKLYRLVGAPGNVMLSRGEQFPHNYNAVSRSAFYGWLNRHFKLGASEPVVEMDYEPLGRKELTVWDAEHPAPKANDGKFERELLKWFTDDSREQLHNAAKSPMEFRKLIAPAVEVIVGRTYNTAGEIQWKSRDKRDRGDYLEILGTLRNNSYDEELPVIWLYPKKWNGRVVVWLDDLGKASLFDVEAKPNDAVRKLIDGGATVIGADLLFQGEFLKDGKPVRVTRVVEKWRECAAYTFGYNHSVFAQRVHDVLTIVKFARTAKEDSHPSPTMVEVAGFGAAAPVAVVARAVAGDTIDATAADTHGFRFGQLLDFRDPQFLPGGSKYGDLPGFVAAGGGHPLWMTEDENSEDMQTLRAGNGGRNRITFFEGSDSEKHLAAVKWLLE
jgi:hypothetical protein